MLRRCLVAIVGLCATAGFVCSGKSPKEQNTGASVIEAGQQGAIKDQLASQKNKAQADEDQSGDESAGHIKKDQAKKESKHPLTFKKDDSEFVFGVKLRLPECFYGENLRFLNFVNDERILYWRHILDLTGEYHYGKHTFGHDAVMFKMNIRNKGVWGDPESIALTTESSITEGGVEFGAHRHAIPRHIFWIRELFLELNVADIFGFPFCNTHTVTFGAFPFELGRGISLGSAYATDASDLGFYAEAAVDQYAFGAKLSGAIDKKVTYDFYAAILSNQADAFENVNKRIFGQAFGRQFNQARGFGIINYIIAGRARFDIASHHESRARLEPYALFNNSPEQKIEFLGDSSSRLWTLGVAAEFETKRIEIGFETAFNLGGQEIKGWDRNKFDRETNNDGFLTVVNSRVKSGPETTAPSQYQKMPLALKTIANQAIISTSRQNALENGHVIGFVPDPVSGLTNVLVNDTFRFTNPYCNIFAGSMMVLDGCYYFIVPDLKLNVAFGYASGDIDPNRDAQFNGESDVDIFYEGFIGLQEVYSGVRVKSAFLLAGSGKVPRLLAIPNEEVFNPYANLVSRFTDVIYAGIGFNWKPKDDPRKFNLNPNILTYWQPQPTRVFSIRRLEAIRKSLINAHLGTEFNIFFESEIIKDLRYFAVGAIFVPGDHFKDIRCLPLNRDQAKFILASANPTVVSDRQPILGNDIGYFLNMGLEYRY